MWRFESNGWHSIACTPWKFFISLSGDVDARLQPCPNFADENMAYFKTGFEEFLKSKGDRQVLLVGKSQATTPPATAPTATLATIIL